MKRLSLVSACVAVSMLACAAQPAPRLTLAQLVPGPAPAGGPAVPPTTSGPVQPAGSSSATGATPPPPPAFDVTRAPAPEASAAAPAPSSSAVEPMPAQIDQQPPPPNMEDAREPRGQEPDGRSVLRTAGWVSLSVGIEATLVAIFSGVIMLKDHSARSSDCQNGACTAAGLDADEDLRRLGGWNAAAWVVGGLGLGAGAILLVTTSKSDSGKSTSAFVSPTGLGVRSTF